MTFSSKPPPVDPSPIGEVVGCIKRRVDNGATIQEVLFGARIMRKALKPREEYVAALTKMYFSRKEAASYLGVSLPTLDNLTKEGIIPCLRFHKTRRVLYKKSALDNLEPTGDAL